MSQNTWNIDIIIQTKSCNICIRDFPFFNNPMTSFGLEFNAAAYIHGPFGTNFRFGKTWATWNLKKGLPWGTTCWILLGSWCFKVSRNPHHPHWWLALEPSEDVQYYRMLAGKVGWNWEKNEQKIIFATLNLLFFYSTVINIWKIIWFF